MVRDQRFADWKFGIARGKGCENSRNPSLRLDHNRRSKERTWTVDCPGEVPSSEIIGTVHQKGHMVNDQHFADSHIREVKGKNSRNSKRPKFHDLIVAVRSRGA
jgi:hypothetical protein